jgi:hypothetical protein
MARPFIRSSPALSAVLMARERRRRRGPGGLLGGGVMGASPALP